MRSSSFHRTFDRWWLCKQLENNQHFHYNMCWLLKFWFTKARLNLKHFELSLLTEFGIAELTLCRCWGGCWRRCWFFTDQKIQSSFADYVTPVAVFLKHNQAVFICSSIWLTRMEAPVTQFFATALPKPVCFIHQVRCTKPNECVERLKKKKEMKVRGSLYSLRFIKGVKQK